MLTKALGSRLFHPFRAMLMEGAPIEAMVACVATCLDLSGYGWSKAR
jgi:hypothetical protein